MRGRLRTGVQARNDGDLWKEDKATGDDSGSVVKECADEIPPEKTTSLTRNKPTSGICIRPCRLCCQPFTTETFASHDSVSRFEEEEKKMKRKEREDAVGLYVLCVYKDNLNKTVAQHLIKKKLKYQAYPQH